MKAKSDLHAPMGAAEKAVGDRDGVTPHFVEHPETKSREPRPAGHHQDSTGAVLQTLDTVKNERRNPPSNPQGADGIILHPEKTATQGHADHESARGRKYEYSEVEDATPKNRTDLVPVNKRAGAGDDRRYVSNTSSFGGKPWKR
jgi:hypothetical protein